MGTSVAGSRKRRGFIQDHDTGVTQKIRAKASSWACPADTPPDPDSSVVSRPWGSDLAQSRQHPSSTSTARTAILRKIVSSKKVGFSRIVAQKRLHLLGHHSDSGPTISAVDIAQFDATDGDRTGDRVVEPGEQPGNRRHAGAGAAGIPRTRPGQGGCRDSSARSRRRRRDTQIDGVEVNGKTPAGRLRVPVSRR